MDQATNQPKLNCKNIIAILSSIHLIFSITSFVTVIRDLMTFGYIMTGAFFRNLSSFVSTVLLVVFIFAFPKKPKTAILVPLIFAFLALSPLVDFFEHIVRNNEIRFSDLLLPIIREIAMILAIISALKGLSNKIFIIIPLIIEFVHTFFTIGIGVSQIAFFVALLLFGLKYQIPTIWVLLSETKENNRKEKIRKLQVDKLTPEQALNLLKEKLNLGIITEEEYQSQRSEIISKL